MSIYQVARGQVWALGKHRLMCGDNSAQRDVSALIHDASCDLIFTSPPYLQQRRYKGGTACWHSMMRRLILPAHTSTQLLLNLGLVHRGGEYLPYWEDYFAHIARLGWRRFGWYVWDKINPMPGRWHGRLSPCHEFIFHFNRAVRYPNKTEICKRFGRPGNKVNPIPGNRRLTPNYARKTIASHKPLDSIIRVPAENLSRDVGHPAMFPVRLPEAITKAYTDVGETVYDPFVGSGTTLLAAEQSGRLGLGMEIVPEYVDMALRRWQKKYPTQLPSLLRQIDHPPPTR